MVEIAQTLLSEYQVSESLARIIESFMSPGEAVLHLSHSCRTRLQNEARAVGDNFLAATIYADSDTGDNIVSFYYLSGRMLTRDLIAVDASDPGRVELELFRIFSSRDFHSRGRETSFIPQNSTPRPC